jgi:excisionase family DNA binding protein
MPRDGAGAMKLLKLQQIAEILNCSRSTVYGLVSAGVLPVHRVGVKKGLRISESDLQAYLAEVRQEAEPAQPKKRSTFRHLNIG